MRVKVLLKCMVPGVDSRVAPIAPGLLRGPQFSKGMTVQRSLLDLASVPKVFCPS